MKKLLLFEDSEDEQSYFIAEYEDTSDGQKIGRFFDKLRVVFRDGKIVDEVLTNHRTRSVLQIGTNIKRKVSSKHLNPNPNKYSKAVSGYEVCPDAETVKTFKAKDQPKLKMGVNYYLRNFTVDNFLNALNEDLKSEEITEDQVLGLSYFFSINAPIKYQGNRQVPINITSSYVEKSMQIYQDIQDGKREINTLPITRHIQPGTMVSPLTWFFILAGYDSVCGETGETLAIVFPKRPLEDLIDE